MYRIKFSIDIIKDRVSNKVENGIHFNITLLKKNDSFVILHCIIENITLVQLIDTVDNANHAVSIVWTLDFFPELFKNTSVDNRTI